MPKYWGKQIFTHGSFPEVGQKRKQRKKRGERERKKERLNDGNNNGQAMHGARKPPGPKYLQHPDSFFRWSVECIFQPGDCPRSKLISQQPPSIS